MKKVADKALNEGKDKYDKQEGAKDFFNWVQKHVRKIYFVYFVHNFLPMKPACLTKCIYMVWFNRPCTTEEHFGVVYLCCANTCCVKLGALLLVYIYIACIYFCFLAQVLWS